MNDFDLESIFVGILDRCEWKSDESKSGFGSTEKATRALRSGLDSLFKLYSVKSVLDIPCGDFHWMKLMDLDGIEYIGADIVNKLVRFNRDEYRRDFRHLDITSSDLPAVDLILCRDCLVHLSFDCCELAIGNIKNSGSKYLLITTFLNRTNRDITTGKWTVRCMTSEPFNFPPPIVVLDELCVEYYPDFNDKCMGLWEVSSL